jgi:polysaccharide export outer membrane protein
MNKFFSCVLSVLSLWIFSSCTLAPGVHFDRSKIDSQSIVDGSDDVLFDQVLIPITPQVIAEQSSHLDQKKQSIYMHIIPELKSSSSYAYRMGPGDRIQVTFWDHPELNKLETGKEDSSGFVLDDLGRINFPYVGLISANRLTVEEFRERLTRAFSKYMRQPQLTVRMVAYRSQKVTLEGALNSPGTFPIDDIRMTLTEAVSRAGGYLSSADQGNIQLVRNGKKYQISLPFLREKGFSPSSLGLQHGDWIHVPVKDERKIFVMGEVGRSSVDMRHGSLTLAEALSDAGGINMYTADAGQIYVIRGFAQEKTQVFHMNAKHIAYFVLADQFPLQARDIVFVDSAPVVRWNRVLNMLLPSVQGFKTVQSVSEK